MGTATPARILLCGDSAAAVDDLRRLLEKAGHAAVCLAWEGVALPELPAADLVVLDGRQRDPDALQLCRRLRAQLAERLLPILLVASGGHPAARLAGLECGADACLGRPVVPDELLAQVNALLRLKRCHDRVAEKTVDFAHAHQQLQQAYQQRDQELVLCRRIQQSLLPRTLPEMPPARFAIRYHPRGRVGGDLYDVVRLDEDHVGFWVADVLGHGVTAGLVSIFVQRAARFKEIAGRSYRLLRPHELLQQLNRELLDLAVADYPFVTMVYALFNRRDRTLSFARAGHPQPLHLSRSGEAHLCQSHGTLLGLFETEFATETLQLRAGDKVLLHSDGLDCPSSDGDPFGTERFLTLAARHGTLPVPELVARLADELLAQIREPDDFTLVGMEVRD